LPKRGHVCEGIMEGMGNLELQSAQLTMIYFLNLFIYLFIFCRYIVEFGGEIQKYPIMNLF